MWVVYFHFRYVENEAAFIVLLDKLQNLVIRQYGYSVKMGSEFLTRYLEWLEKTVTEEKNAFFLSKLLAKKQSFPQRSDDFYSSSVILYQLVTWTV